MYFVLEGQAHMCRGAIEVARLGPGDQFGEVAILGQRARTATVQADTVMRLARLSRSRFVSLGRQAPAGRAAFHGGARGERRRDDDRAPRRRRSARTAALAAPAERRERGLRRRAHGRGHRHARRDAPAALGRRCARGRGDRRSSRRLARDAAHGRRDDRGPHHRELGGPAHLSPERRPARARGGAAQGPGREPDGRAAHRLEAARPHDAGALASSRSSRSRPRSSGLVEHAEPMREELWAIEEARVRFLEQGWADTAALLPSYRAETVLAPRLRRHVRARLRPGAPDRGRAPPRARREGERRSARRLRPGARGRRRGLVDDDDGARAWTRPRRCPPARWRASSAAGSARCASRASVASTSRASTVASTSSIRVSEGFHEKNIGRVADAIADRHLRVVAIAGPSSSGKTTFIRRLKVQLEVNGIVPVHLSLDDYYVDREKTPRDVTGELDFESVEALDLPLLRSNIARLVAGERVRLARYDFPTGQEPAGGRRGARSRARERPARRGASCAESRGRRRRSRGTRRSASSCTPRPRCRSIGSRPSCPTTCGSSGASSATGTVAATRLATPSRGGLR